MLRFASAPRVDFLPDAEARDWIAVGLAGLRRRVGATGVAPRVLRGAAFDGPTPAHLDALFEFICRVQADVGQAAEEFELAELEPGGGPPPDAVALGQPNGHLLHSFERAGTWLLVFVPALFRVKEVLFASVARELGRLAIHRSGGHDPALDASDHEADAELAAVALGLGPFVAGGSYVFENGCCGGGCGVDLRSLRSGLSMPEACWALALDGQARGLSRRAVGRDLPPTQQAALKTAWTEARRAPPALRGGDASASP